MADYVRARPLFASDAVVLTEYDCRCRHTVVSDEENSGADSIVFPRTGAFCKHVGRRQVLADSNQVIFFSKGTSYRVSHPDTQGDNCLSMSFPPDMLVDAFGPSAAEARVRGDSLLPSVSTTIDAPLMMRLHRLYRAASNGASPLAVEESAAEALGMIASAARQRGMQVAYRQPTPRRYRPDTVAAHRDLVAAAWEMLTARFREPLSLGEIANAAHTSRFHMARIFRRKTGLSLHQYQTRLRLSAALQSLNEGAEDLTGLSLGLGFASHSHFTLAFRRAFGVTPTQYRRQ